MARPGSYNVRPIARRDVQQIANSIARNNRSAGRRFFDAAERSFLQFARMPGLGERFETANPRLEGLRCGSVPGFPNHVVFYLTTDDSIEIVRVLHAARDLEGLLGIESE